MHQTYHEKSDRLGIHSSPKWDPQANSISCYTLGLIQVFGFRGLKNDWSIHYLSDKLFSNGFFPSDFFLWSSSVLSPTFWFRWVTLRLLTSPFDQHVKMNSCTSFSIPSAVFFSPLCFLQQLVDRLTTARQTASERELDRFRRVAIVEKFEQALLKVIRGRFSGILRSLQAKLFHYKYSIYMYTPSRCSFVRQYFIEVYHGKCCPLSHLPIIFCQKCDSYDNGNLRKYP